MDTDTVRLLLDSLGPLSSPVVLVLLWRKLSRVEAALRALPCRASTPPPTLPPDDCPDPAILR